MKLINLLELMIERKSPSKIKFMNFQKTERKNKIIW